MAMAMAMAMAMMMAMTMTMTIVNVIVNDLPSTSFYIVRQNVMYTKERQNDCGISTTKKTHFRPGFIPKSSVNTENGPIWYCVHCKYVP